MPRRPIIYKYPFDSTGENPDNLVVGEVHDLPNGRNRPVVPNYGAFFTESLIVKNAFTGEKLKAHTQYKATQLHQTASEHTGKEVCAIVIITDVHVPSRVMIDYQAIGGEFSTSVRAIREMLETLDLDNRPVAWADIIGKPRTYPPGPHLHDAGDIYGYEFLVEGIERLRYAIMVGNKPVLDELRQYIELLDEKVREKLIPPATTDEVIEGERTDLLVSPRTYMTSTTYLTHMSQRNPHKLTPQTFGLNWDSNPNEGLMTPKDALKIVEKL